MDFEWNKGVILLGKTNLVLTVNFRTPSYKFTINICMYLIF
jgi:hypothetical protein